MKVTKQKWLYQFTVIFGPDEDRAFMDQYGTFKCLHMGPRMDLKPWGTREATMQAEISLPKEKFPVIPPDWSKKLLAKPVKKNKRKS